MKKFSFVLLLLCLSFSGYSQITAANYGFTATSGPFTSIASTGTEVYGIEGDDAYQTNIPIGFNFNFCGVDYYQLSACSNGWLSLNNAATSDNSNNLGPSEMSSIGGGVGLLMPFWDDLLPGTPGQAFYTTTGTPGSQKFIFEWVAYEPWVCFGCTMSGSMSFQVTLYEGTNVIEYSYNNGSYVDLSGTIGIANSSSDFQSLGDVTAAPLVSTSSFTSSLSTSPADGQIYRFSPPPPCSGSITAGTASADLSVACSSDMINLSVSGSSAVTGIGYQWQYSEDGISWTDIPFATSNPYIANMPSATDYYFRAIATCLATGDNDSTSSVYVVYSDACYCVSSLYYSYPATNSSNQGPYAFSLTGEGATSIYDEGPATIPASGYEDRLTVPGMTADFQQGLSYSGTLSYWDYNSYYSMIWIDFNDDGVYDPSEEVTSLINGDYTSFTSFTMNIPLTANVGTHRMRLRTVEAWWGPSDVDPCSNYDPSTYDSYDYGVVRDYYINILPAPNCSGTPTGGIATSSLGSDCGSTAFTLNATGTTVASDLTYQWYSSATGGAPWTAIPGATSLSYPATETTATYYQLGVTCPTSSGYDTSTSVFVNYFAACACTPQYDNSPAVDEYVGGIGEFDITGEAGTSINDLGPTTIPSNGYEDRTSLSVSMQQGLSYSGTIYYGGFDASWDFYYDMIWIDFNDDGAFDISEEVTPLISGTYSSPFTISIPITALAGMHRMRVRSVYSYDNLSDMDPCNYYDATAYYNMGSTRDYLVNILPAPPCTGTPTGGTATSSMVSDCGTTAFTLTATGTTIASDLTYQWYSSATGGAPWTPISGATNFTYSASETSATYYQLGITCPTSSSYDTSTSIFVNYFTNCACIPSYDNYPATNTGQGGMSEFDLTGEAGSSIADPGPVTVPASGYEDRTNLSVDLQQGLTYSGNISYGGFYSEEYFNMIWIDFNDDGVFDVSEEVTSIIDAPYIFSSPFTITIPITAATGTHRMRVRNVLPYTTISDIDPCDYHDASYSAYYDYGITRDYLANILPAPACSGAPVMGAAVATPTSGGASIPFVLTDPGIGIASGINYQWQSAPAVTGPWTDIPGATNTSYSFMSIYADTYFRLMGTCTLSGGTTDSSTAALITYVPTPPCFPDASSWWTTSGGGGTPSPDHGIDELDITGFSGTSLSDVGIFAAAATPSGYLDHTSLAPLTMEQGGVYPASAIWQPAESHQELQVWIDFNDNGVYEVTEEVSPVSGFDNFSTPNPTLFDITIPSAAATGLHNMRIRAIWEQNSTTLYTVPGHLDPCGLNYLGTHPNYWSGDVIDYRVNIIPHCPFTATAATGGTICPNTDVTLTGATTAPSYSWAGPGGFTSTDLVATAPGIATASIYTFTATDGTCTINLMMLQNLLPAAPAPVISPEVSTICNGSVQTLTATVPGIPGTVLFSEDFNSGLGSWTVDNTGMTSTSSLGPWQVEPDGYVYGFGTTFHSPDNSQFAITVADAGGSGSTTSTMMISPVFSLAGVTTASLSFQQFYDGYWNDITASVEISTDGGASWNTLDNYAYLYIGSSTSFQTQVYSLDSYLGSANTQIRFNYQSIYGNYWALDNVIITGTPASGPAPTWASSTNLFADPALTIPYVGTAQYSVYVHPTTVTSTTAFSYTASVPLGSCNSLDTASVTVTAVPAIAATGSTNICVGSNVSLSDPSGGGTWSITNASIATVNSSGMVTGLANGTDTVYYTVGGCYTWIVINVSNSTPTITGTTSVCSGGLTTTLSASGSGTWSSSATGTATVDASGVVTSGSAGTAIITFTAATGCSDTALLTVVAPPGAITGTATVCYSGGTTTLFDGTPGGTWTTNAPGVATITSGGVVTGLSSGSATISYTTLPGCYATRTLTLNANPSAITGTMNVCTGSQTTLSDAGGGSWTVTPLSTATITSGGVVSGVSSGSAIVTYTALNGCTDTALITVNLTPSPISGIASVCYTGGTTTLSSSGAGTWSSNAPSVATVNSTGVVTGLGSGAATITFTATNGCYVTRNLTLNPNPSAISGTMTVCAGGAQTSLTESGSGTWSSGATSVATVTSGGVVTGVSGGNAPITFTDGNGCRAISVVTVNALPATILGTTTICDLASATLTDASLPGTWSTGTPGVVTINSSGMITGVTAGLGSVTFTQTSTGCSRTANVTVNGLPTSISGASSLCNGTTTSLTGSPALGTWSTSASGVASIESGTGIVHAYSAGTANITYTNASNCYITTPITVNPSFVPSVSLSASPGLSVCDGTNVSYSPLITNGGTSPTYAWTVNGLPVSTASSYSYVPNDGDIIGLSIVSSLACAIPASASTSVTQTVNSVVYPTLTINGTHNDSACVGAPITINTFPVGAAAPTYQWFVNGTPTATGASYTYIPTNGDVVVALLSTSAACLSGSTLLTTTDTMVVQTIPYIAPEVTLTSTSGSTSCIGNVVAYNTSETGGGNSPTYLWNINGVNVATGPTYFYTPTDGDIVIVTMTSNFMCASPATDTAMMTMNVIATTTPVITITTTFAGSAFAGMTDTFNANIISGGGSAPGYQWFVNGVPVAGATSVTYITNLLSTGDVVTCHVTNNDPCGGVTISNAITTAAGDGVSQVTKGKAFISLVPNPNNGSFVVKGALGVAANEDVILEVTDMVGQVVYRGFAQAKNGEFNQQVKLSGTLANGMYVLNVRSQYINQQFHFVLDQN